jgi:hypothetical protein
MVSLDITQVNYSVSPPLSLANAMWGGFCVSWVAHSSKRRLGFTNKQGTRDASASRVPGVILYSVACYKHSVLVLDSFVKF